MPPIPARSRRFGRFFGNLFSTAGGFAAGAATADTLRPGLQDLVNEAWATHPSRPLDPSVAAEGEVVGEWSAARVRQEAEYNGLGQTRADVLRALAGTAPGAAQLLAAWNRGLIGEAVVDDGLAQLRIRKEYRPLVKAMRWTLPSAETLAAQVAHGILTLDAAEPLAADVGVRAEVFARMVRAAADPPTSGQVLEWGNRERRTDADVATALRVTGLREDWRERVAGLRRYLTPPSDLIRMAVREVFSPKRRAELTLDFEFPSEFADRAALLGMDEDTARDYWAAHWELPSATQGAEMMFRGEISPERFTGLLAALDYAPTWRKPLEAIARRIPTLTDFIRFAQREVFDKQQRTALGLDSDYPEAFTAKAALHGLSEADARDYWAAHWRLPSALQGYRMLWRTDLGMDGLKGLLKALDYPEKWRERLIEIAYTELGRIDIRRALAAGHLTPDQAQERYERIGYRASDARLMVQLAKGTEASTSRDLTREDLTAEYEGLYIDRAAYLAGLDELGYSEAEAVALANLADAKRVKRARAQFESRIHAQFVGHKIDRPEAEAALTKTGTATAARERILSEWENEREVNVRRLTQAQVVKAFKKALMDREAALDVLTDQGLSLAESNVLLDSAV